MRRRVTSENEEEELEIRFGTGYVFDVRQTEGDELPKLPTVEGDPGMFLERLHTLASSKSIEIRIRAFHPIFERGIQGISKGGAIELANGLSSAEELSVLTHELAHELLHRGEDAKSLSRAVLESEAESVAHVVASGIGLQTNESSSDYIAFNNGSVDTLSESLGRIQRIACRILQTILHDEPQRRALAPD